MASASRPPRTTEIRRPLPNVARGPALDSTPELGDDDYRVVARFVDRHLGISMPATKKVMVATRLLRRLRTLGMTSYREYCAYLQQPQGIQSELLPLSDLITTHKTEFFREPKHFERLVREVLPDLARRNCLSPAVWSAGCSTGEEAYTLAMVLADYAERAGQRGTFSVLGTDVSGPCVEKARRAVYPHREIEAIPEPFRKRFLLRGVDSSAGLVRIGPALRACTRFECLNFMDASWPVDRFDIVFCRNVLIYFSDERRFRLLKNLCSHLKPHGYLFVGHSESIHGLDLPVRPIAQAVYRKE